MDRKMLHLAFLYVSKLWNPSTYFVKTLHAYYTLSTMQSRTVSNLYKSSKEDVFKLGLRVKTSNCNLDFWSEGKEFSCCLGSRRKKVTFSCQLLVKFLPIVFQRTQLSKCPSQSKALSKPALRRVRPTSKMATRKVHFHWKGFLHSILVKADFRA